MVFCTWGAMALGMLLLLAFWLPNRTRARRLEERLGTLAVQIAQAGGGSAATIRGHVAREQAAEVQIRAELEYWIERRDTFSRTKGTPQFIRHQEEGRIDFKVALFNARTNLMALAESRNARIPHALGIHETLSTDTRVETALGQLSATVRLVERVIEAGIQDIDRIQPLTPRLRTLEDGSFGRLREYPITLDVRASFEQCLRLLTLLADPGNGFALERLSLEKITHQEFNPSLFLQLVATAGLRRPGKGTDPSMEESSVDVPLAASVLQGRSSRKGDRTTGGEHNGSLRSPTNQWIREAPP